MSALQTSPLLLALVAFVAVGLGVVSLVLLWEGLRQWNRRRTVQRELQKLTRRADERQRRPEAILREQRESGPGWLEPVLLRLPHRHDLQHFLVQADSDWSPATFILLTLGLGAAAGLASLIALGAWLPSLGAATVGALVPYFTIAHRRKKRLAKFEENFPETIDLLGRAIRAGHAFSTGLRLVAEEAPEPVSAEFRQVYEEQKFGLPISDSLLALSDRVGLLDVRIFVTAVLIQIESGGNLAEILDNLAHIIRERFRFRRQLKVHTAHGRMTGIVLASAPVVAAIGMYILNPEYMSRLFTEPLGRLMLVTAAGLQVLGFLSIRRIMDVEL